MTQRQLVPYRDQPPGAQVGLPNYEIDGPRSFGHWLAWADHSNNAADHIPSCFDARWPLELAPLGHNAAPMFGVCQWWECWTNLSDTPTVKAMVSAFQDLIRRSVGCSEAAVTLLKWTALSQFLHCERANSGSKRPWRMVSGRWFEQLTAWNLDRRQWNSETATLPSDIFDQPSGQSSTIIDATDQWGFSLSGTARLIAESGAKMADGQPLAWLLRFGELGIVISNSPEGLPAQLTALREVPASVPEIVRAYIGWSMLDQFTNQLYELSTWVVESARDLVDVGIGAHRVWVAETTLGLEFASPNDCTAFGQRLWDHGVLFRQASPQSLALHFNASCREDDQQALTLALSRAATNKPHADNPIVITSRTASASYAFHSLLCRLKLCGMTGRAWPEAASQIEGSMNLRLSEIGLSQVSTEILNQDTYPSWRPAISTLQRDVYEPARVTPIEKFDQLMACPQALAILLHCDQQIVAQAFAGPVGMFRDDERGVEQDPWRDDPGVLYVLDLTVAAGYRGQLGRLMKEYLVSLAALRGQRAIHGRNRDRYAAAMWAINLSLGAYELQHLVDDYADDQPFRDCLYYRCPLVWPPDGERGRDGAGACGLSVNEVMQGAADDMTANLERDQEQSQRESFDSHYASTGLSGNGTMAFELCFENLAEMQQKIMDMVNPLISNGIQRP
ncbi:MAG TPA: hypothetical protein PKD54_01315 [Pirellulaceae bacterium]|nr:hypothetical protein [Pirellulaceae bacterium]